MSAAKGADADICPTCGSANGCGMAKGDATCWCFTLPHVLPVSETVSLGRCYCRACLERVISDRATRTKTSPCPAVRLFPEVGGGEQARAIGADGPSVTVARDPT